MMMMMMMMMLTFTCSWHYFCVAAERFGLALAKVADQLELGSPSGWADVHRPTRQAGSDRRPNLGRQ
jgi:hypothetical protein